MNTLAQQKYKQNSITTAPPEELTLMLYKGAVRFINATQKALAEGNIAEAHRLNIRVQDIVAELMGGLNMDIPIAKDLMKLYDFLLHRLVEANVKKDSAILEEVKGFFNEFIEVWTEAIKIAKRK
ncbi:flagellar export chaperone FliS [Aneurinibacillus danicus]|uniref:Flagellar protein FliS n=1 Tax=Aneurinibacillus danicus TaxID=267746 RepID=A0A511VCR9_9BACL|nr:flagellar export chaperone FliS [Aneurinibacillus danicus]GEN36191.1 flagellar protein FliS [Aneurinibacillus danicus]